MIGKIFVSRWKTQVFWQCDKRLDFFLKKLNWLRIYVEESYRNFKILFTIYTIYLCVTLYFSRFHIGHHLLSMYSARQCEHCYLKLLARLSNAVRKSTSNFGRIIYFFTITMLKDMTLIIQSSLAKKQIENLYQMPYLSDCDFLSLWLFSKKVWTIKKSQISTIFDSQMLVVRKQGVSDFQKYFEQSSNKKYWDSKQYSEGILSFEFGNM